MVGLDVGTYKIGVVVAEVARTRGRDRRHRHARRRRGLKKGIVVNIDATVEAIRKAVDEAELMAGCEIRSVVAGSAGSHIKGFNSHGVVAVRSREVAPGDVERVIDAARAVALPTDREVLHVLPQEFVVDDQDGIKEPVGMTGVRLEARVHIVTGVGRLGAEPRQVLQPGRATRRRTCSAAARGGRGGAHARRSASSASR